MNYKLQRKMFNEIVFFALLKHLRYLKGSESYRNKIRERNLKKCIECAYKIPFYRKRFNESGITPKDIKDRRDLVKLPVLTKEEFRTWMNSEINKTENKYCMIAQTSGSTGNPLKVLNSPYEYAINIANILSTWMDCGFNIFTSKTLTDADETSENVGYKSFIQKLGILRREMIDPEGDLNEIISVINRFKPDMIRFYKSQYMRIAKYVEKENIQIHKPKFYITQGENVDMLAEELLAKTLGTNMINQYGCVETGLIGTKKPYTDHFELSDHMVAVNIYNKDNILTDELGRIVLTTLYKNTFPLINYDTRDKGVLTQRNGKLILSELHGREDDELKYKDGSSTGWIVLWYIIAKEHDVLQARFIQKSLDNIILQVIKNDKSPLTHDEAEKKLLNDINREIAGRAKLEIQWVDDIPLDPNGKIRMVINNI